MKQAYLVSLTGQGDTAVYVVDKEVWDWINSPRPQSAVNKSSWSEWDFAPEKVKQAVRELNTRFADIEYDDIIVTIGSYENDRCMVLDENCCLFAAQYTDTPLKEAYEWLTQNGYTIIDTYHGAIY